MELPTAVKILSDYLYGTEEPTNSYEEDSHREMSRKDAVRCVLEELKEMHTILVTWKAERDAKLS